MNGRNRKKTGRLSPFTMLEKNEEILWVRERFRAAAFRVAATSTQSVRERIRRGPSHFPRTHRFYRVSHEDWMIKWVHRPKNLPKLSSFGRSGEETWREQLGNSSLSLRMKTHDRRRWLTFAVLFRHSEQLTRVSFPRSELLIPPFIRTVKPRYNAKTPITTTDN